MRKLVIPAVFAAILAVVVYLSLSPADQSHYYPKVGIVTEFDFPADLVTVTDGAGRTWQFSGIEDWCWGDCAALLMSDAGTPEYVYDDEIVDVRYAGVLPSMSESF